MRPIRCIIGTIMSLGISLPMIVLDHKPLDYLIAIALMLGTIIAFFDVFTKYCID